MAHSIPRVAAMSIALALTTSPLMAQDRLGTARVTPAEIIELTPEYHVAEPIAPVWGTAAQVVWTVRAQEFAPPTSAVTHGTSVSAIYQTSVGQIDWWAPVHLPAGVVVDKIELQACDNTATGQILWGMARLDAPAASGANVTAVGATGIATTPGCAFFTLTPTTTLQIGNRNNSYTLFVAFQGDFSVNLRVMAVRVFYRLQVSAQPGFATFGDVPTSHPFHRFIEALAASGVTGGCGGGNYCPDSPVTRGQMAVFLSIALGLHFPF